MQEDDDELGLIIDIDAPLPETAASQPTVVELATSSAAEQRTVTTNGAASSATSSSSSTRVTTTAADAVLESPSAGANDLMLPSLSSPFFEAAAAAAASSSSSSTPQRASNVFDPPVLTASSSRFLSLLTPIRSRKQDGGRDDASTPAAASSASTAAASANGEDDSSDTGSGVRAQLDAYKRKREEQSAARAALGGLLKRGGEDYIDLSAFAKPMQRPRPPPALSSSSSPSSFLSSPASAPWMTRRYSHPNFTLRLHEELLDFAAFISPTSSEERQRAALLSRLSSLILSLFPSASVHPFGSYATKLYLPVSDIDVVVFDSPNIDAETGRTALELIADALRRQNWASYLEVIANARIPIVKFTDRETGLKVDVSRDASAGLAAARYVSGMSSKFPAFRPLLLFLKYFLHCRRLNDTYTGGVGSFLLQLLLLSHLHFHPAQTHDVNLGLLLLSFLDVYAHQLHYGNVGLSLTPPSFYSKSRKQRFNPARPYLLSAENPLDVDHDVGSNSYAIMRVRKAWQFAFAVLTRREVMEAETEGSLLALIASAGSDDPVMKLRAEKKRREAERKRGRREAREQDDSEQMTEDRDAEDETSPAGEVKEQQEGEREQEDSRVRKNGAAQALTSDVAALKRTRVLDRRQRLALRIAMQEDVSWQSRPEKETAAFLAMDVADAKVRKQLLSWWKRRQKKERKERRRERAAAHGAGQPMEDESKDGSQQTAGQQKTREDASEGSVAGQVSAAEGTGAGTAGLRRSAKDKVSASKVAPPRPRWLDMPKATLREYLETEVVEKSIKRRMAQMWRQERKKEKEAKKTAALEPQQENVEGRQKAEEPRQQQSAAPAATKEQPQPQPQASKKQSKSSKKKKQKQSQQQAAAAAEKEARACVAAAQPTALADLEPEEKELQSQDARREVTAAVSAAVEEKAAPAASKPLTIRQLREKEVRQDVEQAVMQQLSAERGGAAVDRQELYTGHKIVTKRFNRELLQERERRKAGRRAEQQQQLDQKEQTTQAREVKKVEPAAKNQSQKQQGQPLIDLSVDDDDDETQAADAVSSAAKRVKLEHIAADGSSSSSSTLTASRGIKRAAEEAAAGQSQQSSSAGRSAAQKKRKT